MRERLLLIEDDDPQARVVARGLGRAGFDVTVARNGARAIEIFERLDFDVVVLDLLLPDIDGIGVCRRIRQASRVPVLMLSGQHETLDVVVALEVGADDYIKKPVPMAELVARARALLRRHDSHEGEERHLDLGVLQIDTEAFMVHLHGQPVALSLTEFRLLVELARAAGRAVSRDLLLERVWGYDYLGDSRLVDMAIKRLRERIEDDPRNPSLVETVRGVGYRLALTKAAPAERSTLYSFSRELRDSFAAVAAGLELLKNERRPNVGPLVEELDRLQRLVDEFVHISQRPKPGEPSPLRGERRDSQAS